MILYKKALTALIGLFLGVSACSEGSEVSSFAQEGAYMDADMVEMGGRHSFSKDGIRTANLTFDTAFIWQDSVNTSLRGINLTVFDEGVGTERAYVTSLRGTMDRRGERLTAEGDVVLVVPAQNRTIRTQELHYDPHSESIWGDSAFVMEFQGQTLRGRSFRTDVEFRNFRITGTAN